MSQFAAKFANIIRAMNCHVICVILANVANGLVFHNKPETAKKSLLEVLMAGESAVYLGGSRPVSTDLAEAAKSVGRGCCSVEVHAE